MDTGAAIATALDADPPQPGTLTLRRPPATRFALPEHSPATAYRRTRTAIGLQLTTPERRFLLHRLADIAATAEAILHNPPPPLHISPWSRHMLTDGIARYVALLRSGDPVMAYSQLHRVIVAQGIEGNRYFADMPPGDPRHTPEACRAAEALRMRAQKLLGIAIGRPVGIARVPPPVSQRGE